MLHSTRYLLDVWVRLHTDGIRQHATRQTWADFSAQCRARAAIEASARKAARLAELADLADAESAEIFK